MSKHIQIYQTCQNEKANTQQGCNQHLELPVLKFEIICFESYCVSWMIHVRGIYKSSKELTKKYLREAETGFELKRKWSK